MLSFNKERALRKLRKLRRKQKLTLRDLERLSGVDYSSISKIETGAAEPKVNTIVKLAKALNVSLDELLEMEQVR